MACVWQTNENAGNLISMVQFLISKYLCVYVHVYKSYILLTKCKVKMAGYWPHSLFAFLRAETKSMSIKTQKENEANIQPS